MALPEQDLPNPPDFIVVFKRSPRTTPNKPSERESFSRHRLEEIQKGIAEINKWLEERGVLGQVRFGGANVLGAIPTFCTREIAEILKEAPNVEFVFPGDIQMGPL